MNNPFKSVKNCYITAQKKLVNQQVPSESIAANFPSLNQIKSSLQKRKANMRPDEPEDFSDLEIADEYASTHRKTQFLRYDNQSLTRRLIIFVDDKALEILSESDLWFMDGTFKCAPRKLLQLFTIHALVENVTFPCVYILSKKEDEEAYREAFGILKDIANAKNVNFI